MLIYVTEIMKDYTKQKTNNAVCVGLPVFIKSSEAVFVSLCIVEVDLLVLH